MAIYNGRITVSERLATYTYNGEQTTRFVFIFDLKTVKEIEFGAILVFLTNSNTLFSRKGDAEKWNDLFFIETYWLEYTRQNNIFSFPNVHHAHCKPKTPFFFCSVISSSKVFLVAVKKIKKIYLIFELRRIPSIQFGNSKFLDNIEYSFRHFEVMASFVLFGLFFCSFVQHSLRRPFAWKKFTGLEQLPVNKK